MQKLIALSIFCVFIQNLLAIVAAYYGHYVLLYPDAYMRLVKVLTLLTHHHWFDHVIKTTNTPYGVNFHCWTRALDVLLASGALALSFFFPLKKALFIWSFILPPVFKVIATFLLVWAFNPLEKSFWQRLFIIMAFLFHPYIQTIYLPLRVDYNFLTTTLFIAYIGIYLRLLSQPSRTLGICLGVCFAFGSWVSLAFFIVGLIPIAYLLWRWIFHPTILSPHLSSFFVSALIACLCFILIENGSPFAYQFDILSLYYFLLLAICAFSYFICQHFTNITSSRFILFSISLLTLLTILFCFERQLILGPYAAASPFWRKSVFPQIIEHISPFLLNKTAFLGLMINLILGLCYFTYCHLSRKLNSCISGLFWLCIPLGVLSIMMLRWNDYAQPIFILAAAGLIIVIQNHVLERIQSKPNTWADLIMATSSLLLAFLPFMIHQLIPQQQVVSTRQRCLNEMLQFVTSTQFRHLGDRRALRLVVEPEVAPVVQFYTHHEVLGGFYHPNDKGLKDTFAFTLGPIQAAKEIAKQRQLDGMLLCPRTPTPKGSILEEISDKQALLFAEPFDKHQSQQTFYFYKLKRY